MLFLLFDLGDDRYALDANQVAEILPLVGLRKVLKAPPGIAGTMNYHGVFLPVIDLSDLVLGRPAPPRLSTRIIVVKYGGEHGQNLLALIAENATETMQCEPMDFVSPGIVSDDAPYLGSITSGPRGLVQRIEIAKLLPASLRSFLLQQPAAA